MQFQLTPKQQKMVQKRIEDPQVQAKAIACLQMIVDDEGSKNADVLAVAAILLGAAQQVLLGGEKKDEIQISKD